MLIVYVFKKIFKNEMLSMVEKDAVCMLVIKALGIFVLSCAANAVWAYTIRSIGQGNAFRAAASSGILGLVNSGITLAYVGDSRMLPFSVAGSIVGTYILMKISPASNGDGSK